MAIFPAGGSWQWVNYNASCVFSRSICSQSCECCPMTNFDRRAFLGTAAVTGAGLLAAPQSAAAQETSTLGKTPHTKFAVNVEMWWTSKRDFLDRVREAAALGFPAIEFWPWLRHLRAMTQNKLWLRLITTSMRFISGEVTLVRP